MSAENPAVGLLESAVGCVLEKLHACVRQRYRFRFAGKAVEQGDAAKQVFRFPSRARVGFDGVNLATQAQEMLGQCPCAGTDVSNNASWGEAGDFGDCTDSLGSVLQPIFGVIDCFRSIDSAGFHLPSNPALGARPVNLANVGDKDVEMHPMLRIGHSYPPRRAIQPNHDEP